MTKEKYTKQDLLNGVTILVLGGVALFIATIILNSLVSSPPSRAEFDTLKVQAFEQNKSIDIRLKRLEDGQTNIIKILTKD